MKINYFCKKPNSYEKNNFFYGIANYCIHFWLQ